MEEAGRAAREGGGSTVEGTMEVAGGARIHRSVGSGAEAGDHDEVSECLARQMQSQMAGFQ